MKIIKVSFIPKIKAPVQMKQQDYFVCTGNYKVAYEKAKLAFLSSINREYIRYYKDKIVMSEVNVIE